LPRRTIRELHRSRYADGYDEMSAAALRDAHTSVPDSQPD
jgi:hypothetical protein